MLAWAGRQRLVTAAVLAKRVWRIGRFGGGGKLDGDGQVSEKRIANRLWRLASVGLVDGKRHFYSGPAAWTVTAKGLREAGVNLPAAKVDLRTYEHDLHLASLCVELEREFPDGNVLTEREIRQIDGGVDEPGYAPGSLGGSGVIQKLHYPDFAIEPEPGADPLVIELELSPKGSRRLGAIMRLYAGARHLSGVRYYVADERTELAVRRSIEREDVNEFTAFADVRSIDLATL